MHTYKVDLRFIADRKGIVSSPDLSEAIEVATPPEFQKGMAGIWSPEHLYTAAVNACFMTTFLAIAENSKLDFAGFSCSAEGILEQVEGKYLMTEIILYPKLSLSVGTDTARATRILEKSEAACLISNSIKSKVTLMAEVSA
jgi:peroxiredoxin-like protein